MRKLGRSAICIAVVIGLTQQATAGLITFDDFSNAAVNDQITNGYQGYNWNNVFIANKNAFPGTGFAAGTVSGNYTGFNGFGQVAEITSPTHFDFVSVSLAGGFNGGNVTFLGFDGATLLYSQTVAVNIAAPQFVTFNFEDINRLSFSSTGGHFAMDNLTLNAEAVPEPSSAVLVGMAMCCAAAGTRHRRRRTQSAGAV